MAKKAPEISSTGELVAETPDSEDNRAATERLRLTIERAGGPSAVSARSGVALRTLNYFLAGREMRRGPMVAIAEACGVSVDYLATGRAPVGHNQPPPEISGPRPEVKLFSLVDAGRLGHALRDAFAVMRERNLSPEWEDVARVAVILYDSGEVRNLGNSN